jgi:hypothetical protein
MRAEISQQIIAMIEAEAEFNPLHLNSKSHTRREWPWIE